MLRATWNTLTHWIIRISARLRRAFSRQCRNPRSQSARPGDMIQAVIFDWGGVLMRTADASPRLAWDTRLDLRRERQPARVRKRHWRRAQLGQIGDAEFWADCGGRLNLTPEALAEFQRDFWAGDRLDGDLVALVRSLRPRYRTALLSNFATSLRAPDATRLDRCVRCDYHLCRRRPRQAGRAHLPLGRRPFVCAGRVLVRGRF